MDYTANVFKQFDRDWAILTAGNMDDHNGMTIAWGGMGTLWNKPVVTAYVRHQRHTFKYTEREEYFTVSFYSNEYREALNIMGTKSGRDYDKEALAGLTPVAMGESVTFKEAKVTMLCRKLLAQDIDLDKLDPATRQESYPLNDTHMMYIAEVVEIKYDE